MLTVEEVLHWGVSEFGQRFAIVTSFQKEGMVLVDMAARMGSAVRVITLDTGRLPAETHAMIADVEARYGIAVERIAPDRVLLGSNRGLVEGRRPSGAAGRWSFRPIPGIDGIVLAIKMASDGGGHRLADDPRGGHYAKAPATASLRSLS